MMQEMHICNCFPKHTKRVTGPCLIKVVKLSDADQYYKVNKSKKAIVYTAFVFLIIGKNEFANGKFSISDDTHMNIVQTAMRFRDEFFRPSVR